MSYKLEEIEGIGEQYAAKLRAAEIATTEALLERGATPDGRARIAEQTGIDDSRILRWVNHADLMRVKGVGGQFAELLEAAGVDTVKELRHRNPANLHQSLVIANTARNLTGQVPSESQIGAMIEVAKALDEKLSY